MLASGVELQRRDLRAVRVEQGGVFGHALALRRRLSFGDHPVPGELHRRWQLPVFRFRCGLDIETDYGSVAALILGEVLQRAPELLFGLDQVRLDAQLGDQRERRGFVAVATEIAAQPAALLEGFE